MISPRSLTIFPISLLFLILVGCEDKERKAKEAANTQEIQKLSSELDRQTKMLREVQIDDPSNTLITIKGKSLEAGAQIETLESELKTIAVDGKTANDKLANFKKKYPLKK